MSKPPIDRAAVEAKVMPHQVGALGAAPASDAPMPTVENEPACVFQPGPGVAAADVLEVTLMLLLQLTGSPIGVEKGALRVQALQPHRVAQLSDSARRFMVPVGTL